MANCFGCGEDLPEEGERCLQCGLDIHLLKEIGSVHSRPRFLFGRVETPINLSEAKELVENSNDLKPPKRRTDKKKPEKQKTADSSEKANHQSNGNALEKKGEQVVKTPIETDPVLFRDGGLALGELDISFLDEHPSEENPSIISSNPTKSSQWMGHLGSIILDFLLLFVLNSAVIYIVSLMTGRSCMTLVRHSFLPLILVHLAFSAIFLSLFNHFYGYSPGTMTLNKFRP